MTEPAALSDLELDLIFYIERFAATNGTAPTDAQLNQRFANLDADVLANFKANPLVQKSFKVRGIVYPAMDDKLTDAQMHAIATMLDPLDRRSDAKKLADIGITTRQWATWLLDDQFAAYVHDRSEKLLANSVYEGHKGLIKGVRNGNVAAVKAMYEITGRYRPNEEQQIDVRRILHTFIEIIQKYVKDPVILHHLAMDLSQAASAESLSTGLSNQMLSNAENFRARELTGVVSNRQTIPIPSPIGEADDD
ncbi:phBC6A51 family helix-turn-helix protein [Streptomyces sp. NPDC048720]|uniref:phBC6A51 family helix-turn-helix protein n=1 Tax=Streptomyces sp. NPDC048720 TaxID=3365588 RepID=UPI00371E99DF